MKNLHLYPENWADTIRPAILKRDHYKCVKCGIGHRQIGYYNAKGEFIDCDEFMQTWAKAQGFKIQKIHLQIAHIDHMKENCDENNLEAQCPKCHLNYDREFNMILRKFAGRQQKKKF